MRGAGRPLPGRAPLPEHGRHGAAIASARASTATSPAAAAARRRAARARLPRASRPIANRWAEALGDAERFPPELDALPRALRRAGPAPADAAPPALHGRRLQLPAPGPVRRGRLPAPADGRCSAAPGADFTGGEFLLVEQRPRAQSRGEAIALERGDAVVFPNRHRPVAGRARPLPRHRAPRREPASRGERLALGVIFHDAE